jgi:hypothetical protein
MPTALNRAHFNRYKTSPSLTEFKKFPGRNHFTAISGKGWEQIADSALDWAVKQTGGKTVRCSNPVSGFAHTHTDDQSHMWIDTDTFSEVFAGECVYSQRPGSN